MTDDLRNRLQISQERLNEVNALLLNPDSRVINEFLDVVSKYGTVEEINRKAREARDLSTLMGRLQEMGSPYLRRSLWRLARCNTFLFSSPKPNKLSIAVS